MEFIFININFKNLFKVFIAFAILYNAYRYFVPWDVIKPVVPLYFSILKDVPWAVIVIIGLSSYFLSKKQVESDYLNLHVFNNNTRWFILVHLLLLAVALVHLFHKNFIDILQRDIKNVQYIFLPMLFPLLVHKERDILGYINWIMIVGVLISLFGTVIYFFLPDLTWDNAVLSTLQDPNNYGAFIVMLSLMLIARILVEKDLPAFWYFILCLFYGAVLSSVSLSALLSLFVGTAFLIAVVRIDLKSMLKGTVYFMVISLLFFAVGFFDLHIQKMSRAYSSYKEMPEIKEIPEIKEMPETPLSWELLLRPYFPLNEGTLKGMKVEVQYTTIAARVVQIHEIIRYLKSASYKDILFGDFSIKNYFEYDNVYLYFLRNDGVVISFMFIFLFTKGFFVGLRKYRILLSQGNNKMASLSLGITAILLTFLLVQFNTSYLLTVYPINFILYFFLLLVFFINPEKNEKRQDLLIHKEVT